MQEKLDFFFQLHCFTASLETKDLSFIIKNLAPLNDFDVEFIVVLKSQLNSHVTTFSQDTSYTFNNLLIFFEKMPNIQAW